MASEREEVAGALEAINRAWLEGRPRDMESLVHSEIVFVFPGFSGRINGWPAFLAGFEEFCRSARLISFHKRDVQVDVIASSAVASFGFDMVYEREGAKYHATGRDLWVSTRESTQWLACWRTMLDLSEQPA